MPNNIEHCGYYFLIIILEIWLERNNHIKYYHKNNVQPIPTRLFTPLSFGDGLGVRLFGEGLGVRLQLLYHSLHLLTKSDGISLRDIDYAVESIGNYK